VEKGQKGWKAGRESYIWPWRKARKAGIEAGKAAGARSHQQCCKIRRFMERWERANMSGRQVGRSPVALAVGEKSGDEWGGNKTGGDEPQHALWRRKEGPLVT
jgi:hypothetical protein